MFLHLKLSISSSAHNVVYIRKLIRENLFNLSDMIRYVDSFGYKSNKVHPEVSCWHIFPTGKFLFFVESCGHLFYFAFTARIFRIERSPEDLTFFAMKCHIYAHTHTWRCMCMCAYLSFNLVDKYKKKFRKKFSSRIIYHNISYSYGDKLDPVITINYIVRSHYLPKEFDPCYLRQIAFYRLRDRINFHEW